MKFESRVPHGEPTNMISFKEFKFGSLRVAKGRGKNWNWFREIMEKLTRKWSKIMHKIKASDEGIDKKYEMSFFRLKI